VDALAHALGLLQPDEGTVAAWSSKACRASTSSQAEAGSERRPTYVHSCGVTLGWARLNTGPALRRHRRRPGMPHREPAVTTP